MNVIELTRSDIFKVITQILGSAGLFYGGFNLFIKSTPEKIIENLTIKYIRVTIYEIIFAILFVLMSISYPIYIYKFENLSRILYITTFGFIAVIYILIFHIGELSQKYVNRLSHRTNMEGIIRLINLIKRKQNVLVISNVILIALFYLFMQSYWLSFFNTSLDTNFKMGLDFLVSNKKDYYTYISRNPEDLSIRNLKDIKSIYLMGSFAIYLLARVIITPLKLKIDKKLWNYNFKVILTNGEEKNNLKFLNTNMESYIFKTEKYQEYIVIPKSKVDIILIDKGSKFM